MALLEPETETSAGAVVDERMERVCTVVDVRSVSSYVEELVLIVVASLLVKVVGRVKDTGSVIEFPTIPDDDGAGEASPLEAGPLDEENSPEDEGP